MSVKKIVFIVIIGIAIVFVLVRIIRNALTSEEAKIKKIISKIEKCIEKKQLNKGISYLSDDYLDDLNYDKESLRDAARSFFSYTRDISVSVRNLRVKVDKMKLRAAASFIAKIRAETIFGDFDAVEKEVGQDFFILHFRKEGGAWKIFRTELPRYLLE